MKRSKRMLTTSVIALLLCAAMLVGTTLALFRGSDAIGGNIVTTGKLDVEMHYAESLTGEWKDAANAVIFADEPWQPGHTDVKYVKISNEGNLALTYQLHLTPAIREPGENAVDLAQVIDVYCAPVTEDFVLPEDVTTLTKIGTLAEVMANPNGLLDGNLIPESAAPLAELPAGDPDTGSETTVCLVLKMQEDAGNDYQGLDLRNNFTVQLIATQYTFERGDLGNDYDSAATLPRLTFPEILATDSAAADVVVDGNNRLKKAVTLTGGQATAFVPAGVKLEKGVTTLTLTVSEMDGTTSNITLTGAEEMRSLDVHIEGVAADNDIPIIITLGQVAPEYLNQGNLNLAHVENGATVPMTRETALDTVDAHNDYHYDLLDGTITVALATFSEVAVVADTENTWKGEFDYSWYDASKTELFIANADQLAGFGAIVGGMNGQTKDDFDGQTVTLLSDINLGDAESSNVENKIFYPIGYYNSTGNYTRTNDSVTSNVSSFSGTFDGAGHTIANFYQNTWEMFGDYNDGYSAGSNYYKDAMGLFGYVVNGTVKNLTVSNFSSDGEYTPTGVIAAYAVNSTFENIAITNCNPRVYNTGNGGIVGIGGNSNDQGTELTFKNITVDNSNKISALWGSWDVACGGIMGMFRGNADGGTGEAHFENCHVSAQIDVYNDVCANYQYYAYRYAGMIIGSIRHNTTIEGKTVPNMAGITASGCTVNFGTWNDYYYCELVANSLASYTHDHQFSRLQQVGAVDEGMSITYLDGTTGTVPTSGRCNYVVVNGEHATENATCYHFVDGQVWKHENAGTETVNGVEVFKEDNQHIYLEFNQLFTGYGWGVSSKGVTDFDGIKTMGITTGDQEGSDTKFKTKGQTELENNRTYKINEIFDEVTEYTSKVPVVDSAVIVSITNLDDSNPVTAKYVAGSTWEEGTITFEGVGNVKLTIQDYYFCKPTTMEVSIVERKNVEKFDVKFTNDYVYRVGNADGSTVSLSSLFAAKDGYEINDADINVTVENLSENSNAAGTFTANTTDWTKGTIQFSGTGMVKVIITDNDHCIPKELTLEVVDAVNATSATSATKNNVVLLNDVGLHTIEVSNGYTLYGNGFKMTATNDVMYDAMNAGFVVMRNGILDNVQIICPNFSYSIVYKKNISEPGNEHAASSDSSSDAYGNVRSAIMVDGNSKILDSFVHGGRAAVFFRSGNLLIDNSTISGGAAANIHTVSAQSLTLRDVTLIQKPFKATVHDTNKTIIGFSGLFECDENGQATPLFLEGKLVQDAWINESYKDYAPSDASSIITDALKKTDYLHDLDGDGTKESLNLGFAYIPQDIGGKTKANVADNRNDEKTVPYGVVEVGNALATANVYSYKNTSGTSGDFVVGDDYSYTPDKQGATAPSVEFGDTNADRVFETKFDTSDNRWESTLTVNLDNGNYDFSFDKLLMQKHGTALSYTVKTESGTEVDTSKPISLTASGVTNYVLTVVDGEVTHTIYFTITATKTSIPEPEVEDTTGGTPLLVVKSKNSDWSCAIPALEGIKIKYYTTNGEVLLDLATLTPTKTGKQNETNNFWETAKDGYKLKVTCGYIHDTKQIYGMPVVVNNSGNKMYFTISSTNGYVSTSTSGRTVTLTYEFTDPNGKTLTFSKTWQFNYADYKNGTQYSYSDFVNGTLKEASSSCVTPDTLVTLADGTKKRIDAVATEDLLMVWDFYNGEFAAVPAAILFDHGYDNNTVIALNFSDGTQVKVVNLHQFFDADINSFVSINADTVSQYVGDRFVKRSGQVYETVTLDSYTVTQKYEAAYGIISAGHYNILVEDMFSADFMLEDYDLFNYFEVGADMRFDEAKMQKDIETYGLYTYEDFAEYLTEEQFAAFNVPYMKVAVGKGNYTYEGILDLIDYYLK